VTTTEPDCTNPGVETETCDYDPAHTGTTRPKAPLNHDYHPAITTPATFIAGGVQEDVCSRCGDAINPVPVPRRAITSSSDWTEARGQLNGQTGSYTLTIDGDFGVAGSSSNTFGTTANGSTLTVTLNGSGRVFLTSQGNLLCVAANQTLIIDGENLILQGLKNGQNGAMQDNDYALIDVMYGTVELRNGTISGNTNTSSGNGFSGGGVFVNGGTFTMSGGTISGNSSSSGGGVWVGGTNATSFTMSGGTISNNTATSGSSGGGGVYIQTGTFRIITGTIFGSNESDTSLRNTASASGAALYLSGGATAQRGTFSGSTWNSLGNLTTTNDTIKVANGALQ